MIETAIKNGIGARVYRQRVRAGWPRSKASTQPVQRKRYKGDYAVYKNGELAVMGTRKECAEFLGVQEDYIHWLTTPTAVKRRSKRRNHEMAISAVKLDDEDDE